MTQPVAGHALSLLARVTGSRWLAVVLTLCLAVVIARAALMPPGDGPPLPIGDKLAHFLAFAALCMPLAAAHPRDLYWLVPAALALGAGIELVQPLVGRVADIGDFIADMAGIGAGVLAGFGWRRMLAPWRPRANEKGPGHGGRDLPTR